MKIQKITKYFSLSAVLVLLILVTPLVARAAFVNSTTDCSSGFGQACGITDIKILIRNIINIILGVAGLVSVLFVIIGGFRYITSAGNEEQAEAGKKTLQNAIIGIIIVVLSFVIVSVISSALTTLPSTPV